MIFIPPSDIQIGPLPVHLYGLMVALAVLASWYAAFRIAGRFGISRKELDQSLLWLLIPGFIGARIYFVAFQWDYFAAHPGQIAAFWSGGMAIYGGLLGGALGLLVFARRKGLSFWNFLDLTAVVVPLAQAIGRWGNYFNQEAFGVPTNLPWGIFIAPRFRPAEYADFQFFHPAFLYESLWNLLVFAVLLKLSKKGYPAGRMAAYYILLYAPARFLIEGLRVDSLYLGSLRVSQLVSLIGIAAALGIIYRPPLWRKK